MAAMKVSERFKRLNVERINAHPRLCAEMPAVGHLLRIEVAKPDYQRGDGRYGHWLRRDNVGLENNLTML